MFPSPSGGSGKNSFDPTKYPTSLSREGSLTTNATPNAFTTILSVTGSGYITRAVADNAGVVNITQLKITIDGVVLFNGLSSSSANYATGIVQETELNPIATGVNSGVATRVAGFTKGVSSPKSYPFTGATAGYCAVTGQIPFNSSLLVEVASGAASATVNYSIYGGAK